MLILQQKIMYKKIGFLIIALALGFTACNNQSSSGSAKEDATTASADTTTQKKPLSPRTSTMANVGENHVHIDYGSPSVRGRVIWGGLVAYDQVWATGAHKATSIEFSQDAMINGTLVNKGKYGFFTIPGEQEWTLIINKNFDQHLADNYDEKLDVVRIKVKPEQLGETQEALIYTVEPLSDKQGKISMTWDKLRVSFEFENK